MQAMVRDFFKDLYTADLGVNPQELVQLFRPMITEEMNAELCKEFSDEEISDTLFQIGPLKAPGPDGFPARFFQKNWKIMKPDVVTGVKRFFQNGQMPSGVNDTSIVLLPKKEDPEQLKDFCPISLCNVIYKVISKCLVNRLRPLLHGIIAPMQSAFIPGRMITDNALIAFECLYAIRSGNNNRKKFGAYKLDLNKAYDWVDWGYLEGVLRRLGFHSKWVQWIMECVTTICYSVRFNNEPLQSFTPSRGLCQGDPLSPYLFLLVANGLSQILQHEVQRGALKELQICRRAQASHTYYLQTIYCSSWRSQKAKRRS
jgi:hypothetical protein